MNKNEAGFSPISTEHFPETEQIESPKDRIAAKIRRLRTYVVASIIGLGTGVIYEGMTSELKSEDPVDRIAMGPLLEIVEDISDELHKAGVPESTEGASSKVVTKGGETLRGIAEEMISSRFDRALETSTGQQWVLATARHWARLNEVEGIRIDDPLPKGKTIILDSREN